MTSKINCNHIIFYTCLFLVGFLILSHNLYYQAFLTTGDHGSNLMAFLKTMQGGHPFRDFWWPYGPLMPYYFALFLKIFGISVQSVLLGETLLKVTAGLFFFGALRRLTNYMWGLLGTIYFWVFFQYFWHTYSHTGAVVASLACFYYLICFLHKNSKKYVYAALLCVFILFLIKVNYGLVSLFNVFVAVLITNLFRPDKIFSPKKFFFLGIVILPATVTGIYFLYVRNLPAPWVHQCLPYLSSDHPFNIHILAGVAEFFKFLIFQMTRSPLALFISGGLTVLFASYSHILIKEKNFKESQADRQLILGTFFVLLFALTYLHEFILSGVYYRINWSTPFFIIFLSMTVYHCIPKLHRVIQLFIIALVIFIVSFQYIKFQYFLKLQTNFFAHPRVQILVRNDSQWIQTVQQTTHFLQTHLKDNETFFAFPYDPLYYFLTEKNNPTKYIIMVDFLYMPTSQEQDIINRLKNPALRYLVMSNRISSNEQGIGRFGKTHCKLLHNYIDQNYERVMMFGDWDNEPMWSKNHGTMIIQKK
ncbi:MAG: glycosyltransferase family 39 protein [Candidatus Omnitrophica bacterium]|nr:glycosyltransferase family 39 protein [Candidatus Omnitrophota bacterium]